MFLAEAHLSNLDAAAEKVNGVLGELAKMPPPAPQVDASDFGGEYGGDSDNEIPF